MSHRFGDDRDVREWGGSDVHDQREPGRQRQLERGHAGQPELHDQQGQSGDHVHAAVERRFDQASTMSATASSGLAVSFSTATAAVCTVGAGDRCCDLSRGRYLHDQRQSGRECELECCSTGQQELHHHQREPDGDLHLDGALVTTVGGATYTATATATSGLAAALTIDASATSVCSISAGVVTFIAAGTCVIDANQAGNANWNAATQAQQSFTVVAVVGWGS